MSVPVYRFSNLSGVRGVAHAVTTRKGGVSAGRCESLNVSYSVGDATENVDENLRRAADTVGSRREDLYSAYQVHGRSVTIVEDDSDDRPRCDVLVTRSPEKTLMLRYADCTPVLLADSRQPAVAVVHAGWRGSAVRAAAAAVETLATAFGSNPRDLLAGIGPAIGPCCYNVGDDVRAAFSDRPWLLHEGKLDLWEANRQTLVESGVPSEQIEIASVCTQCQAEQFFSHRANGGLPAGRFAGLIRLEC